MVLQRDRPIPVWGWDDPESSITATLGEHSAQSKAGADGRWLVHLPAHGVVTEPVSLSVEGSSTLTLHDVLVGEVWLCSGQSNMEWRVGQATNPEEEIAAANHPRIRHIKISRTPTKLPQDQVETSAWKVCSPVTVAEFTAVGYFFGRHLHTNLEVPVGLIGSNWGGTRIEPWTPPEGFRRVPALAAIADHLDEYPTTKEDGSIQEQSAMALYNGMIHPLVPYAMPSGIRESRTTERG